MRSTRNFFSSTPDHQSNSYHSQSSNNFTIRSGQIPNQDRESHFLFDSRQQNELSQLKGYNSHLPPPGNSVSMKLKNSMIIQQEVDKNKENVFRLKDRVEEAQKRVESMEGGMSDALNLIAKDFKQSYVVTRTNFSPSMNSYASKRPLDQSRIDKVSSDVYFGDLSTNYKSSSDQEMIVIIEQQRLKIQQLEKELTDTKEKLKLYEDQFLEKQSIIHTLNTKLSKLMAKQNDFRCIIKETKVVYEQVLLMIHQDVNQRTKYKQLQGLSQELFKLSEEFDNLDFIQAENKQIGISRVSLNYEKCLEEYDRHKENIDKSNFPIDPITHYSQNKSEYITDPPIKSRNSSIISKTSYDNPKGSGMWNSQILKQGSHKFREIKQQIESLENEYATIDSVQQSLEEQVEKYRHCFQEQLKLSSILQKSLYILEEENNDLKMGSRQQNATSISHLETMQPQYDQIQRNLEHSTNLEKDLQKICNQLKKAVKEREAAEKEVQDLKRLNVKNNNQVNTKEEERQLKETKIQLQEANQKIEELQMIMKDQQMKAVAAAGQLQDIKFKFEEDQRKNIELQQKYSEIYQKYSEIYQKYEQLIIEYDNLQEQQEDAHQKLQEAQKHSKESSSALSELKQAYDNCRKQLNKNEEQMRTRDSNEEDIASNRELFNKMGQQLAALKRECQEKGNLEEQTRQLSADNDRLNKELGECLNLLDQGKANIQQLKNSLLLKEEEILNLNHKQGFLSREIDSFKKEFQNFEEALQESGKQAVKCLVQSQLQILQQIEYLILEENPIENITNESRKLISSLYGNQFLLFVQKIHEKFISQINQSKSLYSKLQQHCEGRIQAGEDLKVMGQMILQSYEVLSRHSHVQLPTPLMMLREELEMKRNAIQDKLSECNVEQQQVYEDFQNLPILSEIIQQEESTLGDASKTIIVEEKQSFIDGKQSFFDNRDGRQSIVECRYSTLDPKFNGDATLGVDVNYENQGQYSISRTSLNNSVGRPSRNFVDQGRNSDIQMNKSKAQFKQRQGDNEEYLNSTENGKNSMIIHNKGGQQQQQLISENQEEFLQLLLSQASSIEQLLSQGQ